jgi:hypothetical protein
MVIMDTIEAVQKKKQFYPMGMIDRIGFVHFWQNNDAINGQMITIL